jgi:hypothetical protein
VKAHEEIAANILAQLRSRRDEVVARFSDRDRSIADAAVAKAEAELNAPAMLKDLACVFRKSKHAYTDDEVRQEMARATNGIYC